MSDHPGSIEGALKWADVSKECGLVEPCMSDIAIQTLAAAYRAEKLRAETFKASAVHWEWEAAKALASQAVDKASDTRNDTDASGDLPVR
jgi:hypothetical protein